MLLYFVSTLELLCAISHHWYLGEFPPSVYQGAMEDAYKTDEEELGEDNPLVQQSPGIEDAVDINNNAEQLLRPTAIDYAVLELWLQGTLTKPLVCKLGQKNWSHMRGIAKCM